MTDHTTTQEDTMATGTPTESTGWVDDNGLPEIMAGDWFVRAAAGLPLRGVPTRENPDPLHQDELPLGGDDA